MLTAVQANSAKQYQHRRQVSQETLGQTTQTASALGNRHHCSPLRATNHQANACLCPVVTAGTCDENGYFAMVYKTSTKEMTEDIISELTILCLTSV